MDMTHIYALIDPETAQMRYVGKSNDPIRRLGRHLSTARMDTKIGNKKFEKWLLELVARGHRPGIVVLETIEHIRWKDAERYWISQLRAAGFALLNVHPGGAGPSRRRWSTGGRPLSEEHRAAISETLRGRVFSDEHRQRLSEASKGKPRPELWGRPAWNSGKKCPSISIAKKGGIPWNKGKHTGPSPNKGKAIHSEATRKKLSEMKVGMKASDQTRANMSAAQKRRLLDPAQKEKHDAIWANAQRIKRETQTEINAKISAALKGKMRLAEHSRNISKALSGRKLDEAARIARRVKMLLRGTLPLHDEDGKFAMKDLAS